MTKLENLVNPEVMGDMISAGLPKGIKFTSIAKVNADLVGVPGDTFSIPSWNYIGDAEDVAEGEAVDTTLMTASVKKFAVKKAVKGAEITDEALLSGYGDPLGETSKQLVLSLASKMDEAVVACLSEAKLTKTMNGAISYNGIVEAVDALNEEETTEKYIFIHPNQMTTLRKDEAFISKEKYGNEVMMTGEVGMIAGCRVVITRRVPTDGSTFTNFIVVATPEIEDGTQPLPAVTILMKRQAQVESDRDILKSSTVVTANMHYGVALTNESKVVKVTFKV